MEIASTIVNAFVVAAVGLLLGWLAKGRFKEINRRFDDVECRMEGFQRSLDSMRSDLTQVALAVGAPRPRAEPGR